MTAAMFMPPSFVSIPVSDEALGFGFVEEVCSAIDEADCKESTDCTDASD